MLLTLHFYGLASLVVSARSERERALLAVVMFIVAKVRTRDSLLGAFDITAGRIAAGLVVSAAAFLVIFIASSSASRDIQKLLDEGLFVWTPALLLLPPLVAWRMRRRGVDWADEDVDGE